MVEMFQVSMRGNSAGLWLYSVRILREHDKTISTGLGVVVVPGRPSCPGVQASVGEFQCYSWSL